MMNPEIHVILKCYIKEGTAMRTIKGVRGSSPEVSLQLKNPSPAGLTGFSQELTMANLVMDCDWYGTGGCLFD